MRTIIGTPVREHETFIEAARKAQIIKAAMETIAGLGFANASLAQIARRAGISKSVIGYYFATKDDLVRAVVENFYMTGHLQMMSQMEKATTATELLRLYIRHNLAFIAGNRVETRAISDIISNFRAPDGQPVYTFADAEPMVEGTAAVFAWGQQSGEFRAFDTRIMAVMLRGCVDSFAQQLAANPDLDVERYMAELTGLFVQATRNSM